MLNGNYADQAPNVAIAVVKRRVAGAWRFKGTVQAGHKRGENLLKER